MRVLCAYSTFGYHPHPIGYANVADPVAELAGGENLDTHLLTHPAYLIRRELKLIASENLALKVPALNTKDARFTRGALCSRR